VTIAFSSLLACRFSSRAGLIARESVTGVGYVGDMGERDEWGPFRTR